MQVLNSLCIKCSLVRIGLIHNGLKISQKLNIIEFLYLKWGDHTGSALKVSGHTLTRHVYDSLRKKNKKKKETEEADCVTAFAISNTYWSKRKFPAFPKFSRGKFYIVGVNLIKYE